MANAGAVTGRNVSFSDLLPQYLTPYATAQTEGGVNRAIQTMDANRLQNELQWEYDQANKAKTHQLLSDVTGLGLGLALPALGVSPALSSGLSQIGGTIAGSGQAPRGYVGQLSGLPGLYKKKKDEEENANDPSAISSAANYGAQGQ